MNQTALKTKLGTRLSHLLMAVPHDTELLWDLCCDHGALGRAVLETNATTKVIFNDIHPDIMNRLSALLKRIRASNYDLLVAPAQNIMIESEKSQTFIIAGIGDEQCIAILQALIKQDNAKYCRFIISPTTKVAMVRRYLIKAGFYSLSQTTVTENKRTYEVMTVATSNQYGGQKLTELNGDLVGSMWRDTTDHRNHLEKLIAYYQGQALNPAKPYASILVTQYKRILKNFNLSP
jgi:tRNA (adenine22-N1)-methyltransferase